MPPGGKYRSPLAFYSLMNRLLGRIRQRRSARTTVRRRGLWRPKVRIRIEFGETAGSRLVWCPVPGLPGLTPPPDVSGDPPNPGRIRILRGRNCEFIVI